MDKRRYLEALGQLPIKHPDEADLRRYAPYLTDEQIGQIISAEKTVYFAVPSIRIKHGVQVLSYSKEYGLSHAFASRTRKSYADRKAHGDIFTESVYMKEAMQYAESNWTGDLILDTWVDFGEIIIQDPSVLSSQGYPTTKFVVYFTVNRGWNEIANDHSAPEWKLWDQALSQMTLNRFEEDELKGGRGGYTDYNCAVCGSGLGLSGCPNCHHQFRDDHFRCGWQTPLPPKIVELLRKAGHVFSQDPALLWK